MRPRATDLSSAIGVDLFVFRHRLISGPVWSGLDPTWVELILTDEDPSIPIVGKGNEEVE
jgi:hypothetical protein